MEQKTCGKIIAIKILSIITYVVLGISAVTIIALLVNPDILSQIPEYTAELQAMTTSTLIITLIMLVIPLLIGILANKKMKTAENKSQLIALAILALLFFDVIVGILMLCLNDEEIKQYQGRK